MGAIVGFLASVFWSEILSDNVKRSSCDSYDSSSYRQKRCDETADDISSMRILTVKIFLFAGKIHLSRRIPVLLIHPSSSIQLK